MLNPNNHVYRDGSSLTKAVVILLIIRILGELLLLVSNIAGIVLVRQYRMSGDDSILGTISFVALGSFFVYFPIAIVSFILFLVWMNHSCKNAHSLSINTPVPYTSGWAVGWNLVPIALLWMPKRVMTAIWNHSDPDTKQEGSLTHPKPIETWWTFWLISIFGGNLLDLILGKGDDEISEMSSAFLSGAIMVLFDFVMTLYWIKVVKSINNMQTQKYSELEKAAVSCPNCGESIRKSSPNCQLCGEPIVPAVL